MFPHIALAHSSNDTTNFQRIADGFTGIVDDLSLKSGDAVEEITSKRRAQNLRQLPDYTRFARRLVLVD